MLGVRSLGRLDDRGNGLILGVSVPGVQHMFEQVHQPKAAMAEVKWGVISTSIPRCGCCRWSMSGSMAIGSNASEKTSEKRAMSFNCFTP